MTYQGGYSSVDYEGKLMSDVLETSVSFIIIQFSLMNKHEVYLREILCYCDLEYCMSPRFWGNW